MTESHRTTQSMLLAQQWERAIGELRAFVAMQGSYPAGGNTARWEDLHARTENFITSIEDDGLSEAP